MNLITLNIYDGHGLLNIVVEDMVVADRLRRVIKQGCDAIVALEEHEEKIRYNETQLARRTA